LLHLGEQTLLVLGQRHRDLLGLLAPGLTARDDNPTSSTPDFCVQDRSALRGAKAGLDQRTDDAPLQCPKR
jgi:hypothetical protein